MRRFRVYFNRHREAPQVWSVDEGEQETEVNVIAWSLGFGVTAESLNQPTAPNSDDHVPSALMIVTASGYVIRHGVAEFYCGQPDSRVGLAEHPGAGG